MSLRQLLGWVFLGIVAFASVRRAVAAPGSVIVGGAGSDDFARATPTPDGGLIVNITSVDGSQGVDRVLRLLPSGVEAWRVESADVRLMAEPAADGATWLLASVGGTASLTLLDADGSVVRQQAWSTTSTDNAALVVTSDDHAWIVWGDPDGWILLRVAPDGVVTWTRRIARWRGYFTLLQRGAAGAAWILASGDEASHLVRVSADGATASSIGLGGRMLNVRELDDGRVVIAGDWYPDTYRISRRQIGFDLRPDGTTRAWYTDAWTGPRYDWPAVFSDGSVSTPGLSHGRILGDRSAIVMTPGQPRLSTDPGTMDVALPDDRLLAIRPRDMGAVGHGGIDIVLTELAPGDVLPASCPGALPASPTISFSDGPGAMSAITLTPEPEPPPAAPLAFTWAAGETLRDCGAAPCGPDASEPSSCGAARVVLDDAPVDLDFCDDAEDHADVVACAGATLEVFTSDLGLFTDTVLEIFSSDCSTLLASDDDGGGGRASRVTLTVTDSEPLRIVVRQKDGSSGPDRGYRLSAVVADCFLRSEVSDVRVEAGSPEQLSFVLPAGSDAVNVLTGTIDDFLVPAHPLTACHLTGWADAGAGRSTMSHSLMVNSWILLTASNPSGEGPVGRDSLGAARDARSGWTGCGATR